MKTFLEILDEICGERFNHKYVYVRMILSDIPKDGLIEDAAKEYATQVAKDTLKRAAKNADTETITKGDGWESWDVTRVDEDTILRTEIILP